MTPCLVTKQSTAELLMGHRLRLHPSYATEHLPEARTDNNEYARTNTGDPVFAQNYGLNPRWLPGHITQLIGPHSYRVQLEDGRVWRRYINQLRRRFPLVANQRPEQAYPCSGETPCPANLPARPEALQPSKTEAFPTPDLLEEPGHPAFTRLPSDAVVQSPGVPEVSPPAPSSAATPQLRWSGQSRRRPAYLSDCACAIWEERDVKSSGL